LRSLLPSGATVELRLAGDSEIACAIDLLYGHELSIDGILHEIETGEADTPAWPAGATPTPNPSCV
jgi:hypothetical protein